LEAIDEADQTLSQQTESEQSQDETSVPDLNVEDQYNLLGLPIPT
jgi:hypothetical protein